MLRFFFTRDKLPTISTQEASSFELLSAAEFKDSIIPFSHMYISSDSYLKQIRLALDVDKQNSIIQVSDKQTQVILKQSDFPPNITEYKIDSIGEYKTLLGNKHEINIVIINGIGGDYGDNYIGLAILQRLSKVLAPSMVNFHLMHSLHQRFDEIYKDNSIQTLGNISTLNNIMSVENFMSMDGYIDLSGIVNYTEFGKLSHSTFFLTAFSLENIISDHNLQADLNVDPDISIRLKEKIENRFSDSKPIILLHLISNDTIKTCPIHFSHDLITSLIKKGFNVISPYPIHYSSPAFCDCSDLVTSINELTHMIAASDCVISTGALSMNISASLGKPTILLPITKSNIRTAKLLPEVLIWLTSKNKNLYIDIIEEKKSDHLKIAHQIWQNINTDQLSSEMKHFSNVFNHSEPRSTSKASPKRLAVVIPFYFEDEKQEEVFNTCLDALNKVEGFNALWLEIIDCRFEHVSYTHALNSGISKAIKNECDFIWLLDPTQIPNPNYFSKALKRFNSDNSIAIVAGMQISHKNKTKSVWSGSRSSFPKQQYKVGNTNSPKLNKPTFENWAPLQSAIIRTSAALDVGLLDESLQHQFNDADYCFRLSELGWKIVYEPKTKTYKLDISEKTNNISKENLLKDLNHFYQKWSHLTGCQDPNKLHNAITSHAAKKAKKNIKRRKFTDKVKQSTQIQT